MCMIQLSVSKSGIIMKVMCNIKYNLTLHNKVHYVVSEDSNIGNDDSDDDV